MQRAVACKAQRACKAKRACKAQRAVACHAQTHPWWTATHNLSTTLTPNACAAHTVKNPGLVRKAVPDIHPKHCRHDLHS